MQWVPPRLTSRRAYIAWTLFVVALLGTLSSAAEARAEVVGYCTENASSDIAPAPMVPASSDVLLPVKDCSSPLALFASDNPHEELPKTSFVEWVERAWPTMHPLPLGRGSSRTSVEAEVVLVHPGHASQVFRPPR